MIRTAPLASLLVLLLLTGCAAEAGNDDVVVTPAATSVDTRTLANVTSDDLALDETSGDEEPVAGQATGKRSHKPFSVRYDQ